MFNKQQGPKTKKKTVIDCFKRAFELNPFDYIAADALALVYNISGPAHKELATEWQERRDKSMSSISISMDCATSNNRLLSLACKIAPDPCSPVTGTPLPATDLCTGHLLNLHRCTLQLIKQIRKQAFHISLVYM